MQKTNQEGYLAPEVEVMEVAIECGFAFSDLSTPNDNFEEIGDKKEEIGW